ncbi:MAG: adenylate/guanylate cyclase domain-containing protein [Cyanobacteria bacterium P01_F01_bin.53]
MVKLFFPKRQNSAGGLLQSRLSRQISTWVFLGIVTIESILFVPSYGRRQAEQLHKLETVSQEVLTTVRAEIMGDMPDKMLLNQVRLTENSLIKGVAIYNGDGQQLDSVGESPDFSPAILTNPPGHPFWHFKMASNAVEKSAIHQRTGDGKRYDVAWPSDNSPYILAIRHDATAVQRSMRLYVLGVVGLVVIISAFVTWVTLLVLQHIVIRPLLLLKGDLASFGDSIAQGDTPEFESLKRIAPNELGEVSIAFQTMFEKIQKEICDRTRAEADLRVEQAKADRLLLNILPEAIAARLKDNESNKGAIANRFDTATILFADIVNFTKIAAETGPTALVCQLNDIFSAFDAIAERHNLEKIKTIGDAYMVVGGVPSPDKNHAHEVMAMAIEMMEFAQGYAMSETHQLCLRIGINTGPVVAGVIGTKKFSYDLWGDAVNIASRMESHGLVNRIQVSEDTYLQLKDTYEFEERGYLQIKGRGEMQAFLLKTECTRACA